MTWRSGLLLILLTLLPALSSWSLRGQADLLKQQRLQVYVLGALIQWLLAAACVWVLWRDGQRLGQIGLHLFDSWSGTLVVSGGVTAVLGGVTVLVVWMQSQHGWGESRLLMAVLPESQREKFMFVAVAATAGFCEEMLYRGFAITRLAVFTGGLWSAAVIAVMIFSAGHLYQGAVGVLRAGMLGAVLAVTFIITGSLVPGMITHFLFDVVAGLWGRKWLEKSQSDLGP